MTTKNPQTSIEWKDFFIDACQVGNLNLVQKLCELEFIKIADFYTIETGFQFACQGGHLEVVKFLTTSTDFLAAGHKKINIHTNYEKSFKFACENGHLEVVKFLTTSPELLKAGHTFSDLHANNELGFRLSCSKGHLEIVKFLTTSPDLLNSGHTFSDLHAKNEEGFLSACKEGRLEIVKFLTTSSDLLAAGHSFADIHAIDDLGFRWACEGSHWNVVQFLIFDLNLEKSLKIEKFIQNHHPQARTYFEAQEERKIFKECVQSALFTPDSTEGLPQQLCSNFSSIRI